jgi:hypothetical protein
MTPTTDNDTYQYSMNLELLSISCRKIKMESNWREMLFGTSFSQDLPRNSALLTGLEQKQRGTQDNDMG